MSWVSDAEDLGTLGQHLQGVTCLVSTSTSWSGAWSTSFFVIVKFSGLFLIPRWFGSLTEVPQLEWSLNTFETKAWVCVPGPGRWSQLAAGCMKDAGKSICIHTMNHFDGYNLMWSSSRLCYMQFKSSVCCAGASVLHNFDVITHMVSPFHVPSLR